MLRKLYCWASAVQHAIAPEWQRVTKWERAALNAMKAQDFRVADPMKDQVLIDTVENVYRKAGLEAFPKVIVYQQDIPNAGFIHTGTIIISTGLLEKLEPKEVQGVIAHELGHQLQGSINIVSRFGALAASIIGASYLTSHLMGSKPVAALGDIIGLRKNYGNRDRSQPHRENECRESKGYRPWLVAMVFGAAMQAMSYLMSFPLAAFSRKQEFDADKRAVQITNDPDSLVSALDKLETYKRTYQHGRFSETNTMFQRHTPHSAPPPKHIDESFTNKVNQARASHPPHSERVSQLKRVGARKSVDYVTQSKQQEAESQLVQL